MRVMPIALLTLGIGFLPATAGARRVNRAKEAQPVESAAARAARLAAAEDTGARREVEFHAPSLQNAQLSTGAGGPERGPSKVAPPEPQRPAGPLSGALEELVARQMTRNQGVFDRCVEEAKARDAQLRGQVELAIQVAQKHATAAVVGGATADEAFSTCVSERAKTLKLSLPDLAFPWRLSFGDGATARR